MSEKACHVGSPSRFKPKIYHRAAAVHGSRYHVRCRAFLFAVRSRGNQDLVLAKGVGSWAPLATTRSGVFLQCCKQLRIGTSRETTECVFSLPQKDQTRSEESGFVS